jgi:RimJ/RimL family protein N-acetyltransferase
MQLSKDISIKKLDPYDTKDIWLAEELDKDELVCGPNGYLWSIKNLFNDTRYLARNDIYNSPFAIYDKENPVGYIEISPIFNKMVDISYAILKKERQKGYATITLKEITDIILNDVYNIDKVILIVDINNYISQNVALKAGFINDGLSKQEHYKKGYISYQKTKKLV